MGSSYFSINEAIAPTQPLPTLTALSPTEATAGGGVTTVTCTGTNFTRQSVVHCQGIPVQTSFGGATSLTATIPNKGAPGAWSVTVVTAGNIASVGRAFTFT